MSTPSAAEKGRARAEASRTARGPKRAPGRNEVPPSNGTPHKSTSTAGTVRGSSCTGKRRKLGTPAKRGTASEVGGRNLRASRLLAGGVVARGGAPSRAGVTPRGGGVRRSGPPGGAVGRVDATAFTSRFLLARGFRNTLTSGLP